MGVGVPLIYNNSWGHSKFQERAILGFMNNKL